MDLIRRYFTQIKSQLVGMTISQKLLIALLGVFMVGAVFFTVIWSAKPQMVPLIPSSMTAEDIARVEQAIKGKYEYQVSGDKVMVPVEQLYAIRGELVMHDAMPKDLSNTFATLLRDSSMFTSESTNVRAWNNALQMELRKWLQSFPYVEDGTVIISPGKQAELGRSAVPTTASVFIRTKAGAEVTSNQVLSIVEFVKGAVGGAMRREDVSLVVNGQRFYQAPSTDMPMSSTLMEYKRAVESDFEVKLMKMFASMGDVKIAVNAVPDLSSRTINETNVDPKNSVVKVISETSRETSSRDGSGPQGEPGLQTNGSASVDTPRSGGGSGSGSTSVENRTESKAVFGERRTTTTLAPGVEIKELTASIDLPKSYFVAIFRSNKKDPKADPTDAELAQVITPALKNAVLLAKNTIGAKSEDQIRVDWYDDTINVRVQEPLVASSGFVATSLPKLTQSAKPIGLALFAAFVMFMMLRMVKRAVPAGADADVDPGVFFGGATGGGGGGKKSRRKGGVEQLDAADDVFGEANQGEAVLTGIELDDETLQSRKMVDEVSTMIKENPENAAALVKRWMTKNK